MKILTYFIGNGLYGLLLDQIIEVTENNINYTKVPKSPTSIFGLLNLRGEIITLLDLNQILYNTPINSLSDDKNFRVIRIKKNNENLGIIINEISEIYNVNQNDLRTVPPDIKNSQTEYISNVIYINEKLVFLININKLEG